MNTLKKIELSDLNGATFAASIRFNKCSGRIRICEDKIYLCQNSIRGAEPKDEKKWDYEYSWGISSGSKYDLERNDISDLFILINKKAFSADLGIDKFISDYNKQYNGYINEEDIEEYSNNSVRKVPGYENLSEENVNMYINGFIAGYKLSIKHNK